MRNVDAELCVILLIDPVVWGVEDWRWFNGHRGDIRRDSFPAQPVVERIVLQNMMCELGGMRYATNDTAGPLQCDFALRYKAELLMMGLSEKVIQQVLNSRHCHD